MPPHDASDRNGDAWARLRRYEEKTIKVENGRERVRPGLVSSKRSVVSPASSAYDDEDDGPITTRWAAG